MDLETGCIHNSEKQSDAFELADILRLYLPAFRKKHRISAWQEKILNAIQICRTAACGTHLETCDLCHYSETAYDSCGNRHCPKCQGFKRQQWIAGRLKELLPIPYYHVVFTLPHRLNKLALYNKKLIYVLFYQACAFTLLKFGKDPNRLGAQLGFFGVLHTWGKALCYHIHWHFIVTGGGLTKDGKWIDLPYKDKYLFPNKAMAKVVRARFIKLFKRAYFAGKITIPDSHIELQHPAMFEYFCTDLASDKWINFAKRPFGGPEQVVKYVGRYTHRVAVANSSIHALDNGRILFEGKDHKNKGKRRLFTLSADKFIQRFLFHILPKRFRKIRYGGFLARPVRKQKLQLARKATGLDECQKLLDKIEKQLQEWQVEILSQCPNCYTGVLQPAGMETNRNPIDSISYWNSS